MKQWKQVNKSYTDEMIFHLYNRIQKRQLYAAFSDLKITFHIG